MIAVAQIRFDRLGLIGLQGMLARVAALQPMQHDAQLLEIKIAPLQQTHFACTETVTIGEEEDGFVPLVVPKLVEQPGGLIRGQECDRLGLRSWHPANMLKIILLSNNAAKKDAV